jgi:hypothetical protein
MRNMFGAAAFAIVAAAALSTTAMADGPRPSSENFVPSPVAGSPVTSYDAAMQGPRASSENFIPPSGPASVARPAVGAPHYVWQEGYEHGKWRAHWVMTP